MERRGIEVAEAAERWGLALGAAYPARWNVVHRVTLPDGSPAVLKVAGSPAVDLRREAAALRTWAGDGAVRLLRAEPAALLLERLDPGTTLVDLVDADDDAATTILATVGQHLHRADPPSGYGALPTLDSRLGAFAAYLARHPGGDGPVPVDLVERARRTAEALLRNGSGPAVVLHGDLHHANVLHDAARGWLVIDPHGLVGDPGYEFAAMLYNPLWAIGTAQLQRRLEVLADGTGIDRDRLAAWGFVQAVLSEVWRDEDGSAGTGPALDVALALAPGTA